MARLGMDVDAVEQASRDLKSRAGDLNTLTARIDAIVKQLPGWWQGKDANDFVNNWWPQHKKNMDALRDSIDGLGQSAWNNAQDQRRTSSASGGSGAGTDLTPGAGGVTGASNTSSAGGGSDVPSGAAPGVSAFSAKVIDAARAQPEGSHGGQCAIFAEDMIVKAGGTRIYLGSELSGYQAAWGRHATQVSWDSAQPGDIIQWYDPQGQWGSVHTAILAGGTSEQTATVVDSNAYDKRYGSESERVLSGTFESRNSSFHPGTYMIWHVNE